MMSLGARDAATIGVRGVCVIQGRGQEEDAVIQSMCFVMMMIQCMFLCECGCEEEKWEGEEESRSRR
jgi:hypothetical protein